MPVVSRVQNGTSNETSHHINVSMIAHQIQNLLTSIPARVFLRRSTPEADVIRGKMHDKRQQQTEAQLQENILRFQLTLANDADTADNTLTLLSKSASRRVVMRVADHPNCPETVMQMLAIHPDAEVRSALAENVNLSHSVMSLLLTDSDTTVRHRLAESYAAPRNILLALTEDENPYVACRAAETLNRCRT